MVGTIKSSIPISSSHQYLKMKYISLFAGIGGFDLALNQLGHECVYVNEWDKYAANTYEKNFGHRPDTRSITDVYTDEIPDHDLLVGGFPCQSFSIAGKRGGFNDTRGTLFFDIARILKAKKTRYFILENVKGLLSHDNGQTFRTIIATLDELGYDLQWQVLNSKNFGVPQNRERVFIVGHLRGTRRPEVFPIGEGNGKAIKQLNNPVSITATSYKEPPVVGNILERKKDSLGRNRPVHYARHLDKDVSIRRLTPTECERLQGFPSGWTEGVSDTQRYKCLGNAVTVNVIQEIVKRLY